MKNHITDPLPNQLYIVAGRLYIKDKLGNYQEPTQYLLDAQKELKLEDHTPVVVWERDQAQRILDRYNSSHYNQTA